MEPRIQYAQTEDGISVAYWKMGQGRPLIQLNGSLSHLQKEWTFSERRAFYERLAEHHTLVRLDHRGSGLSDRDVDDLSLEAHVLDVEAVVRAAALGRFAILGTGPGCRPAAGYALKHPEQTRRLILWAPITLTEETTPAISILSQLIDVDWELYTDALVLVAQGWTAGENSARLSGLFRESISPPTLKAVMAKMRGPGALSLRNLQVPTLVLSRAGARMTDERLVREIASNIPNARSQFLDGTNLSWYLGDIEPVLVAISDFLDDDEPPQTTAVPGGFATILFTDMASSTAVTQNLGDAAAQQIRRDHNNIVRTALAAQGGLEIKHTGDGIMASFARASSALDCAIAIQRGVATHKEAHPDSPLGVYVGLNAGEPIAEDDDLFGASINLAARICDHAKPGQILAADVVRQLAAGKDFLFSDLGETELRGFEDPVKLWELSWRKED